RAAAPAHTSLGGEHTGHEATPAASILPPSRYSRDQTMSALAELHRVASERHPAVSSRQAEPLLHQAVRDNPNDAKAWFHLGELCQRQGKSDEASACFGNVVRMRPDWADAWYNFGVVTSELG